jgi:CelD/BcsL family acetyltransferase involved in cellulose biosynthesis
MGLNISTLTETNELRGLSGEWNRLLESSRNTLPFLCPEWALTWWEAYQQRHPLIGDSLRVKVLRRASGELVAVVPFMLTERPGVGPIRARALNFLGADRFITEQRAPIFDPAFGGEVAQALCSDLLKDDEWDWIAWKGLDRQSEFAAVVEREMGLQWGSEETSNLLQLAPTWEEFRSGLKRNIKESLRRCYNSLKRDGLSMRLAVAETPEEIDTALETFFKLHAARAAQADGVEHPDRFQGPRDKRFLGNVCARLGERRIARVFTLLVGGEPVAVRVGFVLPECLYLYYSGYDPAFAKYSVMTTAVAEAIKYAIDLKLPRVHLSMGVDVSKSRWGPESHMLHDAHCVRPRWASQAAHRLYSWGRESNGVHQALGAILPKRRFD